MSTETETEDMNAKFKNRRRMTYIAMYALLSLFAVLVYKIAVVEPMHVNVYESIINWIGSILGGIVMSYFGAAAYEQVNYEKIKKDSKQSGSAKA